MSVQFLASLGLAALATGPLHAQAAFRRGDANRDGAIDISDGLSTLSHLFLGAAAPACPDAADLDDDGALDIGDGIRLFGFVFLGERAPSPPYPAFDLDPTADALSCGGTIDVTGNITLDAVWGRERVHRLRGPVHVKPPATLTIEAGTTVLGATGSGAYLLIEPGARLVALGTDGEPIVFTSDRPSGERRPGDWGGVILVGRAALNLTRPDCGFAGSCGPVLDSYDFDRPPVDSDSSGRLQHVRIEFPGAEIGPAFRPAGLFLFGVGSGTSIESIQVKYGVGDGVQIAGGALDLRHVLCLGMEDDGFDFASGWRGRGQFLVARQGGLGRGGDEGIEADNHETDFDRLPRTRPVLSNVTLIGDASPGGAADAIGILLRRGTGMVLHNAIVEGFRSAGLDIDDGPTTLHRPLEGGLIADHSVFALNGPDGSSHYRTGETGASEESAANGFAYTTPEFGRLLNGSNIEAAGSQCADPHHPQVPDFRPQGESLLRGWDPSLLDSFFVPAPYRGAVSPGGEDWTRAAWISYSRS